MGVAREYASTLCWLGWLYLVQGVPYGLQDKFIPMLLHAGGFTYSSVGVMKLVLLPWMTKWLWSPLLEIYGNRRGGLVVTHAMLGAATVTVACISISSSDAGGGAVGGTASASIIAIGCWLLALNCGCSVQDVLVDGYAMHVIPTQHLPLFNTLQIVMYKVGALCGGGGLLWLLTVTSWTACMMVLATGYAVTAVAVLALPNEDDGERYTEKSNRLTSDDQLHQIIREHSKVLTRSIRKNDDKLVSAEVTVCRNSEISKATAVSNSKATDSVVGVFAIYKEIVSSTGACWISCFMLIHKMGERGAINNFPLFLQDHGVSMTQLAFWNGTVCQTLSILGSFYGGIALSKAGSNINTMMLSHTLQRCIVQSLQCCCLYWCKQQNNIGIPDQPTLYWTCLFSLCYLSFSSGVLSSLTFTLMMRYSREMHSNSAVQCSQYSALASLEVGGKLLFASVAGFVIDTIGPSQSFAIFTALSAMPFILLLMEPSKSADKHKME